MHTQSNKNPNAKDAEKPMSASEALTELRVFLSDTFLLYMKTYAVHWNYEGTKFFSVHRLTEEHYKQLAEAIDEIAERIRALGEKAPVSLREILGDADINESKSQSDDDKALTELVRTHEKLSAKARELVGKLDDAGDVYTADMLTRRVGEHDKSAWMLKSFLGQAHLNS